MEFWQGFITITFVHLLAAASPGPDFALVTRQALVFGRRAGFYTSIGIALGLSVHIVYSALGMAALIEALEIPPGGRIVELGAGTGANLDALARCVGINRLERVHLIDLCPSLLAVARQRTRGMANVEVIAADAATWRPAGPVDRVFLSYSLTRGSSGMTPDTCSPKSLAVAATAAVSASWAWLTIRCLRPNPPRR